MAFKYWLRWRQRQQRIAASRDALLGIVTVEVAPPAPPEVLAAPPADEYEDEDEDDEVEPLLVIFADS